MILKANAIDAKGFRKSTMRIRKHINKMAATFEEKNDINID